MEIKTRITQEVKKVNVPVIKKAVIPAAGFGTRFLPVTKALPKEMLPIVDTPTLQYIVDECVAAGITEILLILGRGKYSIADYFDRSPELEYMLEKAGKKVELKVVTDISEKAQFFHVRQPAMQGSGRAVQLAEAFCAGEPFAVVFGDDVVYNPAGERTAIGQLIDAFNTTGKTIVGVKSFPKEEAVKYGVVQPGAVKGKYTEMLGIVEKPPIDKVPSTLASVGRFVFTSNIFDYLRDIKMRPNGEYYLTDAIEAQAKAEGVFAYEFDGQRYDVGDKLGYIVANIEYALRDKELGDGLRGYLKGLKL
jgi:UTP--glucose-1-phosphate uridylyltransferase